MVAIRKRAAKRAWSVTQHERSIHQIDLRGSGSGWEQWFMLSSDRHVDSPCSDRELQVRHLEKARERNAIVLDFGDLFDAMQGRDDRRRKKSGLTSDLARSEKYIDDLVEKNADFIDPYADLFGLVTPGNHEKAVQDKVETDLTDRFAAEISRRTGTKLHRGGYGGYVIIRADVEGKCATKVMHYFHGTGGGGMMTHGTLWTRRESSFIADADILVGGHTHDSWHLPMGRKRCLHHSRRGWSIQHDILHCVRTGTYKDEYGDGHGGWAVEKGMPPKPIGCVWMRLSMERDRSGGTDAIRLATEFTLDVR